MQFFDNAMVDTILKKEQFLPFPTIDDRAAWEDCVDSALRSSILKTAESFLASGYREAGSKELTIPATALLAFARTGDRGVFDTVQEERLYALSLFVQAECLENKGRFLDPIINIVWALCEQTSWVATAHYYLMAQDGRRADGIEHADDLQDKKAISVPVLPSPYNQVIDLVAGEVGAALAIIYRVLREPLDSVSPEICNRIAYELERRIITPFLERTDFWWMGYQSNFVNNWSPWCTSNCLIALLLMESNTHKRRAGVRKSFVIIEKFLSTYGDDGGCDEGSSYWFRAGGSLFDCLEVLYWASDGVVNLYHQPLVRVIGEFIAKMHIGGPYFTNFADGQSKVEASWPLIFRYGERVQSNTMVRLAKTLFNMHDESTQSLPKIEHSLLRTLPWLLRSADGIKTLKLGCTMGLMEPCGDSPPSNPPEYHILPNIQVATVQNTELFLAVKGGHNDESHNHNDVGQYIIYTHDRPLIVDIGCGEYTKETFGPNRYDIWTMQSRFHNVPEVRGVMQSYGSQYRAADFTWECTEDGTFCVRQDIATAYSKEAGIQRWIRKFQVYSHMNQHITLTESFQLTGATQDIVCPLISVIKPVVDTMGIAILGDMTIHYDSALALSVERITLTDPRLQRAWGDTLYKLIYKPYEAVSHGQWTFTFQLR